MHSLVASDTISTLGSILNNNNLGTHSIPQRWWVLGTQHCMFTSHIFPLGLHHTQHYFCSLTPTPPNQHSIYCNFKRHLWIHKLANILHMHAQLFSYASPFYINSQVRFIFGIKLGITWYRQPSFAIARIFSFFISSHQCLFQLSALLLTQVRLIFRQAHPFYFQLCLV